MAKLIKQYLLNSTNVGEPKISFEYPILQLGIQGPPGTEFYLNGSNEPIKIGASGIFDLDIKNNARITELTFNSSSLSKITNDGQYIIVDIIYEGEEG